MLYEVFSIILVGIVMFLNLRFRLMSWHTGKRYISLLLSCLNRGRSWKQRPVNCFWRYISVAVGHIIPKDCHFDTNDRWPLPSVCCSHILLSISIPSIRWRYCSLLMFLLSANLCYDFLIHDTLKYFSKRLFISKIKKTLFCLLS